MGYTTNFEGILKFDRQLSLDDYNFLNRLAKSRRMARDIEGYGIEGEFYVDGGGMMGQDRGGTIIDYNRPPKTQPGLWLQWVPTEDGRGLEWDGGEKFYNYVEWLQYLIDVVFPWLDKDNPYKLTGEIRWQGEDYTDRGRIIVKDNKLTVE